MLRAIAAAKRKNDKIDASKIADCLRCDFLPECYMTSTEIRDRRRTLRNLGRARRRGALAVADLQWLLKGGRRSSRSQFLGIK